uniref:NADH-ubiquinone oxidoreductase chain 4L n=1 Tax=Diaphanosoma dubium TaxID=743458 RepID=A0A343VVL8_9CRUS|nr:NADH dehydrogenase subunit 4L [Diaphanosoma dubium]AVP74683.1 NADH dehydrogenase subunit 4L [Diaphanosoma dubium]
MFNNSLNFLQIIEVVGCWGIFLFLISFISKRKHLLSTLLSLEGLMLMIFMLLSQLSIVSNFYNFLLIFLSLVACEGALGLSLLVLIVRNYSSDYFKSMNSLKC